eukprot:9475715-Pyramimonas_sp.AAC.1
MSDWPTLPHIDIAWSLQIEIWNLELGAVWRAEMAQHWFWPADSGNPWAPLSPRLDAARRTYQFQPW